MDKMSCSPGSQHVDSIQVAPREGTDGRAMTWDQDHCGIMDKYNSIPIDAPVRIINSVSGRSIYAQKNKNWDKEVGASDEASGVYPDAVWRIIPKIIGFQIINQESRRRLYAQKDQNLAAGFGASSPDSGDFEDSLWNIIPEAGGFRIVNQFSHRSLYARKGNNWQSGFGVSLPSTQVPLGSLSEEIWYVRREKGAVFLSSIYRSERFINEEQTS